MNTVGKYARRVIPLPKEFRMEGTVCFSPQEIGVLHQVPASPPLQTACKLISGFAQSKNTKPRFTIQLMLAEPKKHPEIAKRLSALPNKEQAYAIVPGENKLSLIANAPVGLLYAALTLSQLVGKPMNNEVEIPIVQITDWPDILERGQWGGNSGSDLAWTYQWKLNIVEAGAGVGLDENGQATADMGHELLRQGKELGVKVVPFITHLEQIVHWDAKGVTNKDIISTPDSSKPLPSDYIPGLCMSSPNTVELLGGWFAGIARIPEVSDIMIWLSESASPCFCEKCIGREPFTLEVRCIVKAFEKAKEVNSSVRLRILLTQGSYPVNDKVLVEIPDGVGVTYYDGGRTYDSSRKPMIYPLLEEYAGKSRWLGVYPQLTSAWRSVLPWTGAQFIHYRATEFVDKHLSCVIGYAVPSNRFHEFNIAAWGEFTWNSRGRSPEEFAKVYATINHICEPDLFSRWAMKAGESGWALAESRFFLRLIYDPAVGMYGEQPLDMRFEVSNLIYPEDSESLIRITEEAVQLAHKAKVLDMIDESEVVFAAIHSLPNLRTISEARSLKSPSGADKESLKKALDRLDRCASVVQTRIMRWGKRICSEDSSKLPGRLRDTANVLMRTCDTCREVSFSLGIDDPRPQYREQKLYSWDAGNFGKGQSSKVEIDVSHIVSGKGGRYDVAVSYDSGDYGTDIDRIAIFTGAEGSSERVFVSESQDAKVRVSTWERWHELRIEVPEISSDAKIFLVIEFTGIPDDAPKERRTCSGSIGIRKAWEEQDVSEFWWKEL